jgi:hypothetical protein
MRGILIIALALAAASAAADVCTTHGYDITITDFSWNGTAYESLSPVKEPYYVNLETGPDGTVWTADRMIDGILIEKDRRLHLGQGGLSGGLPEGAHVIFCANRPVEEVPEFAPLGFIAAATLTALGIVALRNR